MKTKMKTTENVLKRSVSVKYHESFSGKIWMFYDSRALTTSSSLVRREAESSMHSDMATLKIKLFGKPHTGVVKHSKKLDAPQPLVR